MVKGIILRAFEAILWRIDSVCHELIEWSEFRRTGKTLEDTVEELRELAG